jgi:ribosomal protein S18 acetylase RimI-like enzyme
VRAPESLAAAVEADLVAHVARLCESDGDVHRDADAVWVVTGDPAPHRNGVLRAALPERRAAAVVERLVAPFERRGLPMMWWVFAPPEPRPEALDRALRARGFALEADLPGMVVDLAAMSPLPGPAGAEVTRVRDEAAFGAWAAVVGRAFEDPEFENGPSAKAFAAVGLGDDAPFRHFLCRIEGDAVGASTLSLGAGVAGLANIAVVPERRGRGIGAAVASAALVEGQRLGLELGALSAGEQGRPLYERLGFREVSRHRTYVRDAGAA